MFIAHTDFIFIVDTETVILERKDISNPSMVFKLDFRDFSCNTWHLGPTLR